jgi:uncharacterized protein (TIGR03083 family)
VPTLAQSSPCKSSPSHALDRAAALGFLEAEIQRIAQLAVTADPAAPVPGCPGWTLAEVVRHVGRLHRIMADMVDRLATEPADPRAVDLREPVRVEEFGEWFAAGGAQLLQVLREADPEAPMYSWAGVPNVGFWIRRLLHETTVHRLDIERAADRVEPVDPAVAVDAVDEFLQNLPFAAQFKPDLRDLHGDGETIHLHATDLDGRHLSGEWLITLEPHGFRWSHAHVKGAAAVRGPITDLLLFVYGRKRATEPGFEQFGDASLLTYWSSKTVF